MQLSSAATPTMPAAAGTTTTKILAGKLFDSPTGELLLNRLITVSSESGLIVDVRGFADSAQGLSAAGVGLDDPNTVDLRERTVLPGFVDAHVHCEQKQTITYCAAAVMTNSADVLFGHSLPTLVL